MKYLIIIVIIALIAYLLWTRTNTSLQLIEGQALLLEVNKQKVHFDTTSVEQKELAFGTVRIIQTILQEKEASLLVFERAVTDELYQFDHRSKAQLMKAAFDAKKLVEVYHVSNLAFYQLFTDDEEAINIIVHQSDDQAIRFAYGFSNTDFSKILETVATSERPMDTVLKAEAITFDDPDRAVRTRWNTPLHTIESLIIPLDSSS